MSRISQKDAKALCQNFINRKSPELDSITGKEDANNVWFDINELEEFIEYAKKEALKQNKKVNGLRVYLGAYDEKMTDKEKSGMTTVFFSATIVGNENFGNSIDLQADAFNIGNYGKPPKRIY